LDSGRRLGRPQAAGAGKPAKTPHKLARLTPDCKQKLAFLARPGRAIQSRSMKHRGRAVCLGLAALVTGAVAVAEAEDALLRRYPYDPACAWGRVGNGKGMVVRCISEEEAKALRATVPATPAVGAKPAPATPGSPSVSSTKPGAAPSTSSPSSSPPLTSATPDTEGEPAGEPEPVSPTPDAATEVLEVTVGPITAEEGSLGIGKLGAPKDRYAACVQKHGGLSARTGEVAVRFLVRGKGIAEGVSVSKRQNLSKEAAQCVADVVDRRRVGTPESQMVGATLLVKFAKVEK
jgi:hypothetical protein